MRMICDKRRRGSFPLNLAFPHLSPPFPTLQVRHPIRYTTPLLEQQGNVELTVSISFSLSHLICRLTIDSFTTNSNPWALACERYLEGLTDQERSLFSAASPENLFYGASAAQLQHGDDSKARKAAATLRPLVMAIEHYGKALDVFANVSNEILTPIWGSIRVLLIVGIPSSVAP